MARNINDIYNLARYIIRKERGVYLSVSDFNQNIDAGLLDAVELWFKGYGEDQHLHDAIRPLRVQQAFTSDSNGFVTFPSNYLHLIGTPYTVYGSSVTEPRFVNEDELPNALKSQLRAVTNDDPILVDSSNGFSIYPQQTQQGIYFYLRRPVSPVLSVTQVGRVVTYDSGTSVQIELNEAYWNNVLARSLVYSGVNMNEEGILQFAAMYEKETE
jgi:hypothetical protein